MEKNRCTVDMTILPMQHSEYVKKDTIESPTLPTGVAIGDTIAPPGTV
jgi:hypothetical protein